jgi:hypothetical protein
MQIIYIFHVNYITMPVKGTIGLSFNGIVDLMNMPAEVGDTKFLINPTEPIPHTAPLNSVENGPITDRFQESFLKEVATISASAAANNWTEATAAQMNQFLNSNNELAKDNMRNFVVSVQVVLIDAAKAAAEGTTYGENDVAVIQFPLYRSNPEPQGAFGGRRRTKMSKRHPTHRTRKHKK